MDKHKKPFRRLLPVSGTSYCGNEQTARSSPRRIARCEWSSGANGVPVGLDRGVLAVDFLSPQAYKITIMIPRERR